MSNLSPFEIGQRYFARHAEICARQGREPDMPPGAFQVGAGGSRYGKYVERTRSAGRGKGYKYSTGAQGNGAQAPQDGKNCCWYDDGIGGGKPFCNPRPHRCDCHLIGATTLSTANGGGPGIPATGFGQLTVDSGDADMLYPYFMSIVAFERVNDSQIDITDQRLVLLTDSKSGQQANMRRASDTDPSFGAQALVYGELKELECVDWFPFASTNRQELTLTFFNPTAAAVHVFVNIWGTPAPWGCGESCQPKSGVVQTTMN